MNSTVVKILSDKEYADLEQELGARVQYVEPPLIGIMAIFQQVSISVADRSASVDLYTFRQSDVEQGLKRLIVRDI